MKRNLIALSLVAVILILPVLVSAQKQGITLDSLINSIKNASWKVFGLVAVVCFVVAGIIFLTSGGDPEKIGTARNAFLWGVAGIIVAILAFSIITFVEALL